MEVLYGGTVFLTHENIIPFLKFGITFQIDELVNLCCVWLQETGLYDEMGQLLEDNIEKRLKLLEKLAPRVRQHSAGSAGSSHSSHSENLDHSSPSTSPDSSSPPSFSSLRLSEKRWSKAPEVQNYSSSAARPKVSGDVSLVPLRSKMRSDNEREWKPTSVKKRIGARHYVTHDETRFEEGTTPAAIVGGDSLNNLDSMNNSTSSQKGWKMAFSKKNKPPSSKPSPVPVSRPCQTSPNLSKWRSYTLTDVERLCSSMCVYPEFVKLEVVVSWVTQTQNITPNSRQELLTRLLGDMDPLLLSDRYIGMVQEDLKVSHGLSLPDNFSNNFGDVFSDEKSGSGCKFLALQWSVSTAEDLTKLRSKVTVSGKSLSYLSFFGDCGLCSKFGKQEMVLKMVDGTPCYDLKTNNFRKKYPSSGVSGNHYHPDTVFHWFIRTKIHKKSCSMVSLITTEYSRVLDILNMNNMFKVVCLQLNKKLR